MIPKYLSVSVQRKGRVWSAALVAPGSVGTISDLSQLTQMPEYWTGVPGPPGEADQDPTKIEWGYRRIKPIYLQ